MFGYNDRVTLSLVNATDIEGNIIPFNLKLPVEEDTEYEIPKNLATVDVFEYQEVFSNEGLVVFSLFVGQKAAIEELVDIGDGKKIKLRERIEIPAIDSQICYQEIGDRRIVYAVVEDNDVVVKDHEQLRGTIKQLSADFNAFNVSVQKIKNFGKNVL